MKAGYNSPRAQRDLGFATFVTRRERFKEWKPFKKTLEDRGDSIFLFQDFKGKDPAWLVLS